MERARERTGLPGKFGFGPDLQLVSDLADRIDGLEALVTSLRNQLEGAKEALRFYAKPQNWSDFIARPPGRDSHFHSALAYLDAGKLAASTLDQLEGKGIGSANASRAAQGTTALLPPSAEPSGHWCCPECGTETSHVTGCTIAEDIWKWVPDTVMPPYDAATQEGDPRFDGAEAYEAHLSARPAQMVNPELVPDSRADQTGLYWLTKAMEEKLDAKRAEGYGGWHRPSECTVDHLARLLIEHLPKGDPVDIANFCMMLHYREGGADALRAAAAGPAIGPSHRLDDPETDQSNPSLGTGGEWRWVPVEPTEEMFIAGDEAILERLTDHTGVLKEPTTAVMCYRAMLLSAPPREAVGVGIEGAAPGEVKE